MKYDKLISAIALLVALTIPVSLTAQEHPKAHPYYKFVDLGTFGGPQSYSQGYEPNPNNRGTAIGWADTPTHDPFPKACFNQDCFVSHGFRWQKHNPKVELGALADGWSSLAQWISANGRIDGTSQNGQIDPLTGIPERHAVIWEGLQIEDLGTLGGNESFTIGDNSQGQVVGGATNTVSDPFSGFGAQLHAFLWDEKKGMQDLGALDTGTDSGAYVINEQGQITGSSYISTTPNSYNGQNCPPNVPTQDPFFWEKGTMIDIGTLGGNCGFPANINNHGQVAGQSDLKGDAYYHPFFWEKGQKIQDLGTFGGNSGVASWINDAGEVIGWAQFKNTVKNHPFLWKKGGKKKDLGILKGDSCAAAWGINSKTQIVGDSGNCFNTVNLRPFLWENGSMYDLSTAFPPNHFQWSEANFINDRAEIAGNVYLQNGDSHAYLLIPCKAGTKGCKGLTAGVAAHPPAIAHNPTAVAEGTSSTSDRSSAVRSRFGRRYPYRGFGTHQPK
jgi:probable HAF family extracellular repeat protein